MAVHSFPADSNISNLSSLLQHGTWNRAMMKIGRKKKTLHLRAPMQIIQKQTTTTTTTATTARGAKGVVLTQSKKKKRDQSMKLGRNKNKK